eukprot:FR741618.1.p3 GENE.FR741618.1~~FR741618.1.p3  ORF type:complete len:100 (+),score=46.19 FR741618.1:824-1123(+)
MRRQGLASWRGVTSGTVNGDFDFGMRLLLDVAWWQTGVPAKRWYYVIRCKEWKKKKKKKKRGPPGRETPGPQTPGESPKFLKGAPPPRGGASPLFVSPF